MPRRKADTIVSQIGNRIRCRREWLGMTQTELSEKAGIGRTSITNIEAGRQYPPVDRLEEIAKALGGTVYQVLGAGPNVQAKD